MDHLSVMLGVAAGYERARRTDCATAGLLGELAPAENEAWLDYLASYSLAMARCPLLFGVPDGGILAFGPAHVQAIGLSPPPFGADDAQRLIRHYLDSFAPALSLSDTERRAVRQHLDSTAQLVLDPAVTSGLSTCARDGGTRE